RTRRSARSTGAPWRVTSADERPSARRDLELRGPAVQEESDHLGPLEQRGHLDELLVAVRPAALRPHAVEGGRDRRGVIAVRAAAGLDGPHLDAEFASRPAHDLQQTLGARQPGRPRREVDLPLETGAGAGDMRPLAD